MMGFLAVTFVVCLVGFVIGDIELNMYDNTVMDGKPESIISLQSLNFSISYDVNKPFSAQILGSITWPKSVDKYYIQCNFAITLHGIVKIDDHLICAPGIYNQQFFEFWNLTWTSSAYNTRQSFVRIDLYSISSQHEANPSFNIQWSFNDNSSFNIINGTYLTRDIPREQQQRMILQNNLTYNTFSTWWIGNMLTIIRRPDNFGFTFGICDGTNSSQCEMQQYIEGNNLWVGVHSYHHSYYEYNLSYNGYDIGYQFSSIMKNKTYCNFYAKISLLSTKTPLPYISFSSRFFWESFGNETTMNINNGDMNCFMNYKGFGLSQTFDICSNVKSTAGYKHYIEYIKVNDGNNTVEQVYDNNLLFRFDNNNNAIYFTTDTNIHSVSDIDIIINKYLNLEYSTYNKYGLYNDTKKGIQAGLMWNLVYTPEESVYFPVARSWTSKDNTDYGMVIFDWDNIFASYQASMDALNISISNLVQVIKAKTPHGFIPNYKWTHNVKSVSESEDRTEPPIGAMVLNKMYKKYGNDILWLIQLLFDDLYDWTNWFWLRRRCKPKMLICLGSDPNIPDINNGENNMQAARYESGLDNSPMYDGDLFNTTTHHMMLYDVGMTAMFMNELKCLMNLGKAINISNDVLNVLNERYEIMLNLTLNELWNDNIGIFSNKFSMNDTFYPRISPTLFYPLLTGDIDVKKAEMMVTNYLLNEDYFCISLDFPTNQSSDCYYGLPSIAKNDPAFASQNYWRGLTWGPMVQLVWWSLDEYVEQSDIIKNGQQALMKQMNEMMLNIWYLKRHICENYSPTQSKTDCTGDHFYHWGGLAGFVSLIHHYY